MSNEYLDLQCRIDTIQIQRGRIFLWGDVDESQAHYIIERLRYAFYFLKFKTIILYIHTDGGDVNAAHAIIDEINGLKALGCKVWTVAVGKAYSCGADILAIGSERYATPNTSMMLHPASFGADADYITYQAKYTEFAQKQAKMTNTLIANACGYKTKTQLEKFTSLVKDSLWLFTDEAIEFGLIDNIWNYKWELDKDENDK